MKRILITGAGSYLGVSLSNYLAKWPEQYETVRISVRDDSWKQLDFHGYDVIYHVAALVHQPQTKDDPVQRMEYERVNTHLPVAIAEKAKAEGVKQFVFLSTASVYGLTAPIGKTVMITRDTERKPVDNYGISKAKAEDALALLADDSFRLAILRPPMIYGPGCKGNYVTLSKLARKLPVFPFVENGRSMLYIDNLCELVRLIIDREDSGVFCPQDGEYVNTCNMVQEIAAAQGKKIVLIPGFGWALKLLSHATGMVDKAFGSLCYDRELSRYPVDYVVKDVHTAILESEGK